MNFVFLSPHFPPNYDLFCHHLQQLGVTVMGIADQPYGYLSPYLRDSLSDYVEVADLHDYDELMRACAYFIYRHGRLDRLDSLNEYWLETEAHLRTDFNIPGIHNDTIAQIKNKSRMKECFEAAGVRYPRGKVVHNLQDGLAYLEEVGFPVVVKPDIGVGATHTYKLEEMAQVQAFFARKPARDFLMEEFVAGEILAFDGLTNAQGEPVFYTAHQYSQGVMDVVNTDNHVYYYSLREIPPDLEDAGMRLLKVFNVRERFFHFEFFRTPSGELVALEVNMRPPGGFTLDMFNYANDINIYQEWAHVIAFNHFSATYERRYHCCYVGRKYNKRYAHSHEEILRSCRDYVVHHEALSPVFQTAMGNYGYLIRAAALSDVLDVTHFIQELAS